MLANFAAKYLKDSRFARVQATGIIASFCLALQICLSRRNTPIANLAQTDLQFYAWWACSQAVFFILFPAIAARALWQSRPRDLGWTLPKRRHLHLKEYVALLLIGLAATGVASQNSSFRWQYPIYHDAAESMSVLLIWELLYAAQFVATEFFFRGFLLRALEPELGSSSVFFALPLYVLFHFGKPLPEVFASIATGIALGALALRSRSVWGGIFVHILVAASMDLLALYLSGRL